jgi:hypothetical protein
LFCFPLFFLLPPLPPLCSAFYRARELAKTSSPVNQSTSGILGKRRGPWSDWIAADFPVESAASARKGRDDEQCFQTVPLVSWGNYYFSLWSLNFWHLSIRSLISLIK